MLIAFSILALLVYIVVAYFVVTKLIIPAKNIWIKIFDGLVLAGVFAGVVTALVKAFGG